MSRIGKLPVTLPEKVKVSINDDTVSVEGPKGKLEKVFKGVTFEQKDGAVEVLRADDSRQARALHGLSRSLLSNMVTGVSQGFERKLELYGVGFRAEVRGQAVNFNIGYSHQILFPLPEGVSAVWKEGKAGDKQGEVTLTGIDKDLVGRTAADIRALRPPEPYKGKGIKYADEFIRRKQGKSGGS